MTNEERRSPFHDKLLLRNLLLRIRQSLALKKAKECPFRYLKAYELYNRSPNNE